MLPGRIATLHLSDPSCEERLEVNYHRPEASRWEGAYLAVMAHGLLHGLRWLAWIWNAVKNLQERVEHGMRQNTVHDRMPSDTKLMGGLDPRPINEEQTINVPVKPDLPLRVQFIRSDGMNSLFPLSRVHTRL